MHRFSRGIAPVLTLITLLGCQSPAIVKGRIIVDGTPVAGAIVFSCDTERRYVEVVGQFSDPVVELQTLAPALRRRIELARKVCHSETISDASGEFEIKPGEFVYVAVDQSRLLGYWIADKNFDLTENNSERLIRP